MRKMLKIILIFVLAPTFVLCHTFNFSATKILKGVSSNAYFGYSILLQRGDPPLAIIGAPRALQNGKKTGAVYRCNLNSLKCTIYNQIPSKFGVFTDGKNGDFLGAAIDGDDTSNGQFFVCAPRFITLAANRDHFTNGKCFYIKNNTFGTGPSTTIFPMAQFSPISQHFLTAYYDAAFAMAGFDVEFFPDQNELLLGAPGKALFNGALIQLKLPSFSAQSLSLQTNLVEFHDNFYGYSMSWGKFFQDKSSVWYVLGGPRGANLRGDVVFIEKNLNKIEIKKRISGEEFGGYFGASLMVLRYKDGGDDLLVGAPMYSGKTYDEGCVYYYKNSGNSDVFNLPIKLMGARTGGRFGTVVQGIGDVDLDSYLDCVIAAPFEDDGIGAVYIYFGSKTGFNNDHFERITPKDFKVPNLVVKGFGLGLSRGNDIDGNGHNDLVIGAYRSGQVFYMKSKNFIDSFANITASIRTLYTTTNNFTVNYCLVFYSRSNKTIDEVFSIQLLLQDERLMKNQLVRDNHTLTSGKEYCQNIKLFLKKHIVRIDPLIVQFHYKLRDEDTPFRESTLQIPVAYDCGFDEICQVDLTISANSNQSAIILDATTDLHVDVAINTTGNPAYQPLVIIKTPMEITLINLRECDFINTSYVCVLGYILDEPLVKKFDFQLGELQMNRTEVVIEFSVTSFGVEQNNLDNVYELKIPVVQVSNPFIYSVAKPTNNLMVNKSEKFFEVNHLFYIGNNGPSRLNLTVFVFVPRIWLDGNKILTSNEEDIGIINNGVINQCEPTDLRIFQQYSKNKFTDRCSNNGSNITCQQVVCENAFLFTKESTQVVVKLIVDVKLLIKYFGDNDNLSIASGVHLYNGTDSFDHSESTTIYGLSGTKKISVWIYIVSVFAGLLLLIMAIFVLYKMNFFKREYKEMLNEQENSEGHECELLQEESKNIFYESNVTNELCDL